MEFSYGQLINAVGKIDGTQALPAIVGAALGIASIIRTPGGSAAGDYLITLTDAVAGSDSVVMIQPATSDDPTKFCGPSSVTSTYFNTSATQRQVITTDAQGNPADTFFVFECIRTAVGPG
jgi:hypothetical protein